MIEGHMYHLGVVTRDIDTAMTNYREVLGLGPFWRLDTHYPARFRGHDTTIANHNAFGQWGELLIEIVQPGLGHGPQHEALRDRGEGIFHVGYSTTNPDQRPTGVGACFEVLDTQSLPTGIVYLDTLATLGYFVELVPEAQANSLMTRVRSELTS
jgi:methylmalonyl-CoA/ethylmalonyl-CoA epimerase